MFARTSVWSGSPETLGQRAEHASTKVRSLVESLPGNVGYVFLIDRAGVRALTLTLWESEEAALASDAAAGRSRASTQEATGIELVERGRYHVLASSLQSASQAEGARH